LNIFNRKFNVKSNIISWTSNINIRFVHFNRFNLRCYSWRSKCYIHFWSQNTSFHSSNRNCSYSSNFINILYWYS
jgi:hypothetical protein